MHCANSATLKHVSPLLTFYFINKAAQPRNRKISWLDGNPSKGGASISRHLFEEAA